MNQEKHIVSFIGSGRAAYGMAHRLKEAGYALGSLSSPNLTPDKPIAELFGKEIRNEMIVMPGTTILVLAVPDDKIKDVVDDLVELGYPMENRGVIHLSGIHPSKVLNPLKELGAQVASAHPVHSFQEAPPEQARPFFLTLEGDPELVGELKEAADAMRLVSVEIDGASKALYHAACTVASNYAVTLADASFGMFRDAGLDEQTSFDMVLYLMNGSLKNFGMYGPETALTGPVVRGDVVTVEKHMEALRDLDNPGLDEMYNVLGKLTAILAFRSGRLTAEQATEIVTEIEDE